MSLVKQICVVTGLEFDIGESEQEILRKSGELHPAVNESLPLPTVHPLECLRQMWSFGNLDWLYKGKSAISGKSQLTRYNPADSYKICTMDEFWTDAVDNTQFGRDYDFSRPFFPQFAEVLQASYLPPLNVSHAENSDYVNGADNIRNCFLCFNIVDSENCLYSFLNYSGSDNCFCSGAFNSQYCYECIDVYNCYESQHCQDCKNCSNCIACFDCIGCSDCIGCIGLRNVKYHLFNENLGKERYQQAVAEYNLADRVGRERLLEKWAQFLAKSDHTANRIIGSENCSGSYIRNSSNLHQCYGAAESQDCGYVVTCMNSKDFWRGLAVHSELGYQALAVHGYHNFYTYSVFNSTRILYSYLLYNNCADCFACVGLKGKSYCVLNKQYSKEEYFEILPRIIQHMKSTGEWGMFIPPRYAPHTYEESCCYAFLDDITDSQIKQRGYRSSPIDEPEIETRNITAADELPSNIEDVEVDKFANTTVRCVETGKAFNLQKRELEFYKRHSIPLPTRHWRLRLRETLAMRDRAPAV